MKKLISLMFVLVFLITICGCKKTIDNGSSLSVDSIIIEEETIEIEFVEETAETGNLSEEEPIAETEAIEILDIIEPEEPQPTNQSPNGVIMEI